MALFSRRKDQMKQFPTLNPQQQQLLQQILEMTGQGGQLGEAYGGALSQLQEYLDPTSAAYQRFAQPEINQFEQETVPGLAERFAGAGAMGGGLSSSGFGQALSSAGGQLQSRLAAMKAGLQQQALGDILGQYGGMTQQGLGTPSFGYSYQQGSPSLAESLLTSYAGAGFPGLNPMAGFGGGFGRGFGR